MLGDGRRCDVGTGGELDGEEIRGGSGDAECAEGLRYLIAGISKPASRSVEREREAISSVEGWRVPTLLFAPKLNTISLCTFRLFSLPFR